MTTKYTPEEALKITLDYLRKAEPSEAVLQIIEKLEEQAAADADSSKHQVPA